MGKCHFMPTLGLKQLTVATYIFTRTTFLGTRKALADLRSSPAANTQLN